MTGDVCPVMRLRCASPRTCGVIAIGCKADPEQHPITEDALTKEQQITLRQVERELAALKAREGRI